MGPWAAVPGSTAGSRAISALLPAAGPSAGSSGSAHPTLALGMDKGRAWGGKRAAALAAGER